MAVHPSCQTRRWRQLWALGRLRVFLAPALNSTFLAVSPHLLCNHTHYNNHALASKHAIHTVWQHAVTSYLILPPCLHSLSRSYTAKEYLQLVDALRAKAAWLAEQDAGGCESTIAACVACVSVLCSTHSFRPGWPAVFGLLAGRWVASKHSAHDCSSRICPIPALTCSAPCCVCMLFVCLLLSRRGWLDGCSS